MQEEIEGDSFNDENIAVVESLKRKVILLDPGHGGPDTGGISNGLKEKDLVLFTSVLLAELLIKCGAEVIFTRTDDSQVPLAERVKISEKYIADAVISLHYNTAINPINGTETYYANAEKDMKLAKLIQSQLVHHTGLHDRGIKHGEFFVNRNVKCPSVLVELAFISNLKDQHQIKTLQFQEQSAIAIFNALSKYFE
ncbi:N-acetylmuramoyl-L-alanine amidase family protein [Ureibacillus endophyticus]|uniref:N-acetylmuramoyl-L-alanine amidase n=1 Tax=Ureibacillus endophyticus TaxID=1978490 RepID=A0A494Z6Y9_9BACL|nr:N-acetylmuramoyl-L-alanine amidase [Lysinibacillus endophyticus]RKQ18336.1 N-acetylmuramoyl-L-alanine amidase [Lysinibacillus endophyticus]